MHKIFEDQEYFDRVHKIRNNYETGTFGDQTIA
jgi:hypothetical protein